MAIRQVVTVLRDTQYEIEMCIRLVDFVLIVTG